MVRSRRLGHQAIEPAGRQQAGVRRRELFAQEPLAGGVDRIDAELRLELPQFRHQREPTVHRRDDGLVVLGDLPADLLEPLVHTITAAASAAPLKTACTTMPG